MTRSSSNAIIHVRRRFNQRTGAVGLACFALLMSLAPFAPATKASAEPEDSRVAENAAFAASLRQSAEDDVSSGDTTRALEHLKESVQLDPEPAAYFRMGELYESQGKTASAWGAYHNAIARARLAVDADVGEKAAARQEAVLPKMMKVKLAIGSPNPDLRLDGRGLPDFALLTEEGRETDIPLDPGEHELTASKAGKLDFHQKFTLSHEGEVRTIFVPPLVDVPPALPPLVPLQTSQPMPPAMGVGIAMAATGAAVGGASLGILEGGGSSKIDLGAGIALISGAAVCGIGLLVILVSPTPSRAPPPVTVHMSKDFSGVVVQGAW